MRLCILVFIFFFLSSCANRCWDGPCIAIPGDSKASRTAQAGAVHSFFSIVKSEVPYCKYFSVNDTKYNGTVGKGNYWSESWIIGACNTKWQGEVWFNPDGNVAIKGGRLFKKIQ